MLGSVFVCLSKNNKYTKIVFLDAHLFAVYVSSYRQWNQQNSIKQADVNFGLWKVRQTIPHKCQSEELFTRSYYAVLFGRLQVNSNEGKDPRISIERPNHSLY